MASAHLRIDGASASPKDVAATSMELFSFSIEPPKPLIMASAISAVVPSAVSASDSSCTSLGAVLISASHFDIWFFPKMAEAAAICSDSERSAKASCSSCWICTVSFIEPSAFTMAMPSSFIQFSASSVGEISLAIPVFSALAASLASMPALAMTPM